MRPTKPAPDDRALRILVRCFPRWFRDAEGDELIRSYRAVLADRRAAGESAWRTWAWLVADAARTGLRARWTSRHAAISFDTPSSGRTLSMQDRLHAWMLAARALRRAPLFSAVVVLVLGLGLGASTAIFGLAYPVLLRPLPYAEPDALVWIANRYLPSGQTGAISAPEFQEYRRDQPALAGMAALRATPATMTGAGTPRRLEGWAVSPGYFALLGTAPALGRAFTPDEERPGQPPVVVLSDALWRTTFGADPAIVGRAITLEDRRRTVVGVMPRDHAALEPLLFPSRRADFWEPLTIDPATFDARSVEQHGLFAIARLAPGATPATASAGLSAGVRRIQALYPSTAGRERDVLAAPLHERVASDSSTVVGLLAAAVGAVLLLGCFNVMSLLVARSHARATEVAVRAAMGATGRRLAGLVLRESLLLGLAGGLVGLGLAVVLRDGLRALLPPVLPALDAFDGLVPQAVFCLLLSIGVGLLAGGVPAVHLVRRPFRHGIAAGGRAAVGAGRSRIWRALVVAQVAGAVALVTGAGLLLRTMAELRAVDLGFDTDGLVLAEVQPSRRTYDNADRIAALYGELEQAIAALPGVSAVTTSWQTPLQSGVSDWPLMAEAGADREWLSADPNVVSETYFRTMGIPIVAGRGFEAADRARGTGAVILNETAARRLWPDGQAVGRRVNTSFGAPVWREVIGVVADVRGRGVGLEPRPQWYVTFGESPFSRMAALTLAVRTSMAPESLRAQVVAILSRIDPDVPVGGVGPMTGQVAAALTNERLLATLLTALGAAALALAAIGIYGLFAFTVRTRQREIGLRMALGADRGRIMRSVVVQALLLGLAGVGLGLIAAIGAGRLLSEFLYGVSADDPGTMTLVVLLVLGAIALAAVLPARRASRIDPLRALAGE